MYLVINLEPHVIFNSIKWSKKSTKPETNLIRKQRETESGKKKFEVTHISLGHDAIIIYVKIILFDAELSPSTTCRVIIPLEIANRNKETYDNNINYEKNEKQCESQ